MLTVAQPTKWMPGLTYSMGCSIESVCYGVNRYKSRTALADIKWAWIWTTKVVSRGFLHTFVRGTANSTPEREVNIGYPPRRTDAG